MVVWIPVHTQPYYSALLFPYNSLLFYLIVLQAAVRAALRTSVFERYSTQKNAVETNVTVQSEIFWCQFVRRNIQREKNNQDINIKSKVTF